MRNITTSDFENIYLSLDKLGEKTKRRLADDFLDSLFAGKDVLFSQLKDKQPLTFAALEQCGPVMLLEKVVMGESLCTLALQSGDRLIVSNVYNKNSLEYKNKKDLEALLEEFHGYYQYLNGFNNPLNLTPAVSSLDLPGELSSWQYLDQYRGAHRLPARRLNKLKKAFGHTFFNIWIRSREDDLILLDFGRRDKKLYHMKGIDFDDWYELKNPVDTIDRYCAHKIAGNSGEFDFRNER